MAASLFASGDMPPACKYGHDWAPGSAGYYLSWMTCSDCPGALRNPGGFGHHRARCRGDDEMCPAVWYSPPHIAA